MQRWLGTRGFVRTISSCEKHANFGHTIDQLNTHIPHLLERPLPTAILHQNITLKLLPETHAIEAHGLAAYKVSSRIIQSAISLFVLPPHSRILILSANVVKAPITEDQIFHVHWRTAQDPVSSNEQMAPFSSGKILKALNLSPHEYPILAGSFEFRFSPDCDKVLLHIVRDVEYLTRPTVAFE